ncbi:MAG: hypothetical protein J5913_01315 [Prevotella sp.]|nr:hypothetical protein [Prevotella sp.]
MKKILMMAAFAAAGAAFTACSSDDTLATQQTPEAPVVKGTPFKVSAFAEGTTRATRYNSDAWGTDGTSEKVTMFKLYGKQGTNDPWMKNAIFTRAATSTDWAPIRDQNEALSEINWPTADTETNTSFYAITDNAFGSGDAIANVSEWQNTEGSLVYTLPTKTSNILWYTNNSYDYYNDVYNEYTYVDASKLNDVMVASKNTNEEDCNGTVALDFKHILGGFKISAMFVSDAEKANTASATVKSVMVCGLDGEGTYTFGGTPTPWSTNTKVNYYYELPSPIQFNAEAESGTHTPVDLFAHGTWLALPQTTTAWDESASGGYPTTGAYIALRIHDSTYDLDYILCYPLTITIEAAKSKKIVINIADGRDPFDSNAAYFYTPATSVVTG